MYNYSLGIQRHPEQAGFKQMILKPIPDPTRKMEFAKGYYDSVYGRISSEWKLDGINWIYKATIPANTTATLYLPARSLSQITEDGKPVAPWKGISQANGQVIIPLGSGSYSFAISY